jgi:hypothetical protein
VKGISVKSIVKLYRCNKCGYEFCSAGMMDENLDAARRSYLIRMGVCPDDMDHKLLIDAVKLADENEKQRRSFVFGNCNIDNQFVTKEMVNEIADKMRGE